MVTTIKSLEPRDCRRVRRLLDDFLNGELSVETGQEILSHLDHCPGCRQEKSLRQKTRRALAEGWKSLSVPPDLAQRIQAELPFRSRRWFSWGRSIAAVLVLGLMLALASLALFEGLGPSGVPEDHFGQIALAHLYCRESGWAPGPMLPLPPGSVTATLSGDYKLITAHLCEIGSIHFVHYVVEGEGARFSLIFEDRDSTAVSVESSGLEKIRLESQRDLFVAQRQHSTVAILNSPRFLIYVVSEADQQKTIALVDRLVPALNPLLI